jgi:tetratricopeptide (TPR) repeat protein
MTTAKKSRTPTDAPKADDTASEPRAASIPFHVHLARIREMEKSQQQRGQAVNGKEAPFDHLDRLTPMFQQLAIKSRPENDSSREQFVALRKRAAELESAKLYDQALVIYQQLINLLDDGPEDLEIALLNRIGDLMTRVGKAPQSGDYYEMAADKYAARGLADNAIAVYGKILRTQPNRTPVYLKLGRLAAKKGLRTDAKRHYLEYVARVKVTRNYDEAFRALAELADQFPDQDDVRLALIDQLQIAGYQDVMVKQLEMLLSYYRGAGRTDDARLIAVRLEACLPKFAG